MKILVCISNVPDTTSKITFTDNNTAFNNQGVQYIINPYDELALSKAIDLTNSGANGSITVITVGDSSTEATLRKALAIGADNAVRIDSRPLDAWYVANQIVEYAKDKNFDLILTGRESIDYNGGQLAGLLGDLLQIPSVSIVKGLNVINNEATIEREIEGGKEIIVTQLPVVIGAAEGIAEPKIANMRGIMGARTKPLDIIASTMVDPLTTIVTYEAPPVRGTVTLIEEDNIDELVSLLHHRAKVI